MGLITKAVRINNENQITDGVITGSKLADNTVTANKIAILDYIRSLQYDVYNDARTAVKARIDHDEATNYVRYQVGADNLSLGDVLIISASLGPTGLGVGNKVSLVSMNLKRLTNLAAPLVAGDALRFGNAEITDNEISPTANISRTKLAVGSPQRAVGSVTTAGGGYYDITGLLTPGSYPALAIGYARLGSSALSVNSLLVLRNQSNIDLNTTQYAHIDDSGAQESVFYGAPNTVSALISSGSVKLSHNQNPFNANQTVEGTLMVIEL